MNRLQNSSHESSSSGAAFFMAVYTSLIGWGLPQGLILASAYYGFRLHQGDDPRWSFALLVFAGSAAIYGLDRFLESRIQVKLGRRHRVPLIMNGIMLVLVAIAFLYGLSIAPYLPWIWLALLTVVGACYLSVTLPLFKAPPGLKEFLGATCWLTVVYGPHTVPQNLKEAAAVVGLFLMGFSNFAWASHQDHDRDKHNKVVTFSQVEPELNVEMARITAAMGIAAFAFAGPSPNAFQIAALAHGAWLMSWRTISVDWCFLPLPIAVAIHLLS